MIKYKGFKTGDGEKDFWEALKEALPGDVKINKRRLNKAMVLGYYRVGPVASNLASGGYKISFKYGVKIDEKRKASIKISGLTIGKFRGFLARLFKWILFRWDFKELEVAIVPVKGKMDGAEESGSP